MFSHIHTFAHAFYLSPTLSYTYPPFYSPTHPPGSSSSGGSDGEDCIGDDDDGLDGDDDNDNNDRGGSLAVYYQVGVALGACVSAYQHTPSTPLSRPLSSHQHLPLTPYHQTHHPSHLISSPTHSSLVSLTPYHQQLLGKDVVMTTSVRQVLGEKTRAVQGVVGEGALIQGLSSLLGMNPNPSTHPPTPNTRTKSPTHFITHSP